MYVYDKHDQTLVKERAQQFRDQTQRYLDGKLPDEEFQQLRLRNGLYMQLHAPMLRVAIPYGMLSSRQLRMLGHVARKYDKDYGHFTTRQNIQYNWPELKRVPDILDDLASVEMHAIQTSGNCIRNTTSDHLAGVAKDEIEDPRPYCEFIRQWSTLHPEFNWLPRKFKIAVTGAENDRAAVQVHDIGLEIVKNSAGEIGFRVYVGGGLGRTPVVGPVCREFLPREDLLSYLEAILRIYNLLGRRDNKYKARIKILVRETGVEKFTALVEEEWQRIREGALKLSAPEFERMQTFFSAPNYEKLPTDSQMLETALKTEISFANWVQHNTVAHKVDGYRIAYVSLKAPGIAPGDVTSTQMEAIADLADQFSFGEIRTTHEQNLVLADVKQDDLYELWQGLKQQNLATPNIGTVHDMICCPGLDFCSLANASSIPIAKAINERFDDYDYLYDLGEIKLKMSGCMNACGHHHVGHIGILGVEKHGQEWYQVTLGGSAANDAALGDRLGRALAKDEIVNCIETILNVYLEQRLENETFLTTYRRLGMDPFKERVYADPAQQTNSKRSVAA